MEIENDSTHCFGLILSEKCHLGHFGSWKNIGPLDVKKTSIIIKGAALYNLDQAVIQKSFRGWSKRIEMMTKGGGHHIEHKLSGGKNSDNK